MWQTERLIHWLIYVLCFSVLPPGLKLDAFFTDSENRNVCVDGQRLPPLTDWDLDFN